MHKPYTTFSTSFILIFLLLRCTLVFAAHDSFVGSAIASDNNEVGKREMPNRAYPIQAQENRQSMRLESTGQEQSNHPNKKNTENAAVTSKKKRLTIEERRVLRRQIHDASSEFYAKPSQKLQ